MWNYISYDELYHHGIKGQKWGVRRYQNEDGTLTYAGKVRYLKKMKERLNTDIFRSGIDPAKLAGKIVRTLGAEEVQKYVKSVDDMANESGFNASKEKLKNTKYVSDYGPAERFTSQFIDYSYSATKDMPKKKRDAVNNLLLMKYYDYVEDMVIMN